MTTSVLQIVKGSEFRTSFVWRDAAGNAQDATGATVTAALRDPWTLEIHPPVVTAAFTNAVTGEGEITLDEIQTALIETGAVSELVITVVAVGVVTDIFVGAIVEGV